MRQFYERHERKINSSYFVSYINDGKNDAKKSTEYFVLRQEVIEVEG